MGTRPAGVQSRFRRGVAIATGLVAIGGLAVFAAQAGASPQPTVAQVQAKVNQLTSQYDKVTEQLDQVGEQLSAAQTRLAQVRADLNHAEAKVQAARMIVAQFAAASFEDTGATSVAGVLTDADPSIILQQGSLLLELSGARDRGDRAAAHRRQPAGQRRAGTAAHRGRDRDAQDPARRPQELPGQADRHRAGHAWTA